MSDHPTHPDRYQRQALLPQFGASGQARLARSRVLLVGCGALGCAIAEQLVRAGVGFLRIADRDLVEWTNLQRQTLFDEAHARNGIPKAIAAAERLGQINSGVRVEPAVVDVHAGNVEALAGTETNHRIDVIADGTDNVQTRYLLNDVAVKHGIPWVYGACVGTVGRMMAVAPGKSACLRCVFPTPPRPEELATCDTAGVLGPAAGTIGALQAAAVLKILLGEDVSSDPLLAIDVWTLRVQTINRVDARDPNCPCCGARQFPFLDGAPADATTSLCGRNAVQIRPEPGRMIAELTSVADRLSTVGGVEQTRYFVRCQVREPAGTVLTVFPDGRALIQGTSDLGRARSLYARFLGS